MPRVSPTRMNLVSRRESLRVAAEGARLLKSKRDALLGEFLSMVDVMLDSLAELERSCGEAANTLTVARGAAGAPALHSAAAAAHRDLPLQITMRRVWGLAVPEISARHLLRQTTGRGYAPVGAGALVDETAEAFESVLHLALDAASHEIRLRRIGEELRRTNRRMSALEQILIPLFKREITAILRSLEERDREDAFRLKRLKAKGRRRAGGHPPGRGAASS